jgi:outer membrane immunogenic protein
MNATWVLRTSAIAVLLAVAPAAFAADMRVRPAPPPPVAPIAPAPIPYFDWSGFYIGGNLGGAWESSTITDAALLTSFSASRSGFIGGGQIGYNWQITPMFLVGVEWMFDGTDIRSTDIDVVNGLVATSKVDWITSIAARFGVTANNWLFYGKAGGGWVHESFTLTDGLAFASVSDTKGGWLVGAGIEYGFLPHWTVRVEWDHLGLDSETGPGLFVGDVVTLSRHFDLVTAGVNYKF